MMNSNRNHRLADLNVPFYDGFANTGALARDYLLLYEQNMAADASFNVPNLATLNSWKSDCVTKRVNSLQDDLIENYSHVMEALLDRFTNLEDLEAAHKREKSKAMAAFDAVIHAYSPRAYGCRKQLQAGIIEKKTHFTSVVVAALSERVQRIYEKHYHLIDAAKKSSTSQQITLVDAGSPYSNLVAFKSVLGSYLSSCRQELAVVGSLDDSVLVHVLARELQNILENSRLWVDGFEALYQQALVTKTSNQELLQKLLEDDRALDIRLKNEEIESDRVLSDLQEQLTQQRIVQSSEIEEKSSRVEVLGEKVERAARLNETEKIELQGEVIHLNLTSKSSSSSKTSMFI